MKKLILPLIIILFGVGGGGAAGYFLRPAPPPMAECACDETMGEAAKVEAADAPPAEEEVNYDYVNLKNQFVVPVIENETMTGMVVMSLSLEVTPGSQDEIFNREPRLRDEFLRILFAYSTIGGFAGSYLESSDLRVIRNDLTKAARDLVGESVNEVLIVDLIRQGI